MTEVKPHKDGRRLRCQSPCSSQAKDRNMPLGFIKIVFFSSTNLHYILTFFFLYIKMKGTCLELALLALEA